MDSRKDDFLIWLLGRCVVTEGGCWLWTGADSGGEGRGCNYPKMKVKGITYYVHIVVYRIFKGNYAKGLQLDHTCKHGSPYPFTHRRCVNPDHLEPVTQSENMKRNFA